LDWGGIANSKGTESYNAVEAGTSFYYISPRGDPHRSVFCLVWHVTAAAARGRIIFNTQPLKFFLRYFDLLIYQAF
jgi:hypothetical protein